MSVNSITSVHKVLYQAQACGGDVFKTHYFPYYRSDYIDSKGRLERVGVHLSSAIHMLSSAVSDLWNKVFGVFLEQNAFDGLNKAITSILDYVYPINPINNSRHMVVPRLWEKNLGDFMFFSAVFDREVFSLLREKTIMPNGVQEVFSRLVEVNKSLLNPEEDGVQFNYRLQMINSSQMNAFAVMGGGVAIHSALIEAIDSSIVRKNIQDTTVVFADGSTVTLDLSSVTADDVLAAVLGHEITHIASRHSAGSLLVKAAFLVFSYAVNFFLIIHSLKAKSKDEDKESTSAQKKVLQKKENDYKQLREFIFFIGEISERISLLFSSRKNEYEADITGAYFLKQAGYNPLGALYLQELLLRKEGRFILHKYLECLYTHPYGENRKRALFGALSVMSPDSIHITNRKFVDLGHDPKNLSPAMQISYEFCKGIN